VEYDKICFVIMPFGKKPVTLPAAAAVAAELTVKKKKKKKDKKKGKKKKKNKGGTVEVEIDFDKVYDEIFRPAIAAVELPEGGKLEPRRTDKDFFTADITQDMYEYIEYSRFALADLTGLNANVLYELGARHRARESGTAIFRQSYVSIPFDISHIKAFPYEHRPADSASEARALVTRVLTESLVQNRLDSPVRRALAAKREAEQEAQTDETKEPVDAILREAENAIRHGDKAMAMVRLHEAVSCRPADPLIRMRLGLLYKERGDMKQALAHFRAAVKKAPRYAEAHREIGVVENKLFHSKSPPPGVDDGEASLRKAIKLSPDDFDAMSSLAGILKRKERFGEAHEMYARATKVSHGNSYPLLNEIKLEARATGKLEMDDARRTMLARAERPLRIQVADKPPYNPPWSFFDLAEMRLYAGDSDEFLDLLERGVEHSDADWMPGTFRDSLQLLIDGGVVLPGLNKGIERLNEAVKELGSDSPHSS